MRWSRKWPHLRLARNSTAADAWRATIYRAGRRQVLGEMLEINTYQRLAYRRAAFSSMLAPAAKG